MEIKEDPKNIVSLDAGEKLEVAKSLVTLPQKKKLKKKSRTSLARQQARRQQVYALLRRGFSTKEMQDILKGRGIKASIATIKDDLNAINEWYAEHPVDYKLVEQVMLDRIEEITSLAYRNMVAAKMGTKEANDAVRIMLDAAIGVLKISQPQRVLIGSVSLDKMIERAPAQEVPETPVIDLKDYVVEYENRNKDTNDTTEGNAEGEGSPPTSATEARSSGYQVEDIRDGGVSTPSGTDSVS